MANRTLFFLKILVNSTNQNISSFYHSVVYGYFDSENSDVSFLVNLILFIVKFYIHKCKFSNKKLHLFTFNADLERYFGSLPLVLKKASRTISICRGFNVFVWHSPCVYLFYPCSFCFPCLPPFAKCFIYTLMFLTVP